MTTGRPGRIAALLLAVGLAGCGSANSVAEVGGQVMLAVRGQKSDAASSAAAQAVTRAQLMQLNVPLVRVSLPSRGSVALLGKLDGNAGTTTWSIADASSYVTVRDGVLISTRGLGDDLMSSSVPSAARLATGSGTHQRVHFYLDGADTTIRRDYACTLSSMGPETITVVERTFPTRHVVERCESADGTITNHYWLENGGKIRQSQQWISQSVGYMKLELLID